MRYFGLDLGTKTLGVAISDRLGIVASFYKNINYNGNYEELINILKDDIIKENVEKIILGFPKNMNNSQGIRCEETLQFKKMLEDITSKEVILEDERMTTKIAESILIQADLSRKKRKKVIDGMSAVVILQSYLDRS